MKKNDFDLFLDVKNVKLTQLEWNSNLMYDKTN